MEQANSRKDYPGAGTGGEGIGLVALKLRNTNTYTLGSGLDNDFATWVAGDVVHDFNWNFVPDGTKVVVPIPGKYRFALNAIFPPSAILAADHRQLLINILDADDNFIFRSISDLHFAYAATNQFEMAVYGEYYMDTGYYVTAQFHARSGGGFTIPVGGVTMCMSYINTR